MNNIAKTDMLRTYTHNVLPLNSLRAKDMRFKITENANGRFDVVVYDQFVSYFVVDTFDDALQLCADKLMFYETPEGIINASILATTFWKWLRRIWHLSQLKNWEITYHE